LVRRGSKSDNWAINHFARTTFAGYRHQVTDFRSAGRLSEVTDERCGTRRAPDLGIRRAPNVAEGARSRKLTSSSAGRSLDGPR
jgi:hypothetical protein